MRVRIVEQASANAPRPELRVDLQFAAAEDDVAGRWQIQQKRIVDENGGDVVTPRKPDQIIASARAVTVKIADHHDEMIMRRFCGRCDERGVELRRGSRAASNPRAALRFATPSPRSAALPRGRRAEARKARWRIVEDGAADQPAVIDSAPDAKRSRLRRRHRFHRAAQAEEHAETLIDDNQRRPDLLVMAAASEGPPRLRPYRSVRRLTWSTEIGS